jgi:hypothetical protein
MKLKPMFARIVVLATAPLMFGVACQVADQHETASSAAQKVALDSRMEALKYSKFCTDSAAQFWNRHKWKDQHDLSQITSYTSHYSKKLNKCLVDVHGVLLMTSEDKVSESDHIYDALEDAVLGGRVILRKGGPEGEIEAMVSIQDGHDIRDEQKKAAFVPWFQSLMIE